MDFDFVTWRQECIKTDNQLGMAFEEIRDARNYSRSVDTLRFELFHNVKEIIVNLWLIPELVLDLVKIRESVFDFEPLELLLLRTHV